MFRRIRGWLVAGVATALVLTGCSAGGSAPAPAETAFNKDTAAEITFSWWGNEDRAKRFEQVIGMFNEEYPNVKVVRNFNSWGDYWTARNTEAAGRALPDAVMMDASYLGEYANKGLLKDLGPFRQNTLTLEGVSDSVLGSGTIGDKLVAVPLGTNAYSMMYNKKVLDAYGIEYPTSDMDWNQLNAFLMKVNQAGAGADPRIYGAEDYTGGFPGFIYHLMQSGNEVFTADGKPTFTEADVVSYLDSTASMRDAGDFYPIARSIALSPKGGFLAGETAVWFNFSTTVQQAMSDIGTEEIGMVAPAGQRFERADPGLAPEHVVGHRRELQAAAGRRRVRELPGHLAEGRRGVRDVPGHPSHPGRPRRHQPDRCRQGQPRLPGRGQERHDGGLPDPPRGLRDDRGQVDRTA